MSHLVSWRAAFIHRFLNPFSYPVRLEIVKSIRDCVFTLTHWQCCRDGFYLYGRNRGVKVRTDGTTLEFSSDGIVHRDQGFYIQTKDGFYDPDSEKLLPLITGSFRKKIPSYLSTEKLFLTVEGMNIVTRDSFGTKVPGRPPDYLYKDKFFWGQTYNDVFAGRYSFYKLDGIVYCFNLETQSRSEIGSIKGILHEAILFQGSYYLLFSSIKNTWKMYVVK